MKKLLLSSIFILFFLSNNVAQSLNKNKTKQVINQGYYEFNFGAALIDDLNIPFPGISFLIGNKTYFKNNFIVDAEIGFALPSIGTAKIGIGYKTRSSEFIVGIRPWPMHFYIQTELSSSDKGSWIMSVEVSSFYFNRNYSEQAYNASMASLGMLNFGYRWNIR